MTDAKQILKAVYSAKEHPDYLLYPFMLMLAVGLAFGIALFAAIIFGLLASLLLPSQPTALVSVALALFLLIGFLLSFLFATPLYFAFLRKAFSHLGFSTRLEDTFFPIPDAVSIYKFSALQLITHMFCWIDVRALAVQVLFYLSIILLAAAAIFMGQQISQYVIYIAPILATIAILYSIIQFYVSTKLLLAPAVYSTETLMGESDCLLKSWEMVKGKFWELFLLNSGLSAGLLLLVYLLFNIFQSILCVSFIAGIISSFITPIIYVVSYASIFKIIKS